MTDEELVKALRDADVDEWPSATERLCAAAADRIEALITGRLACELEVRASEARIEALKAERDAATTWLDVAMRVLICRVKGEPDDPEYGLAWLLLEYPNYRNALTPAKEACS